MPYFARRVKVVVVVSTTLASRIVLYDLLAPLTLLAPEPQTKQVKQASKQGRSVAAL